MAARVLYARFEIGRLKMDCVGYVDEVSRFCVSGWVADRDDWSKSLSVEILVKGRARITCRADGFRGKLDELHPDATGRYVFQHYFATPLSMYEDQDISVRVTDTTYNLIQQVRTLSAIEADPNTSIYRPSAPVLLTTMGRTGSTAVMAVLAQHPKVTVAGARPYEIEMGCYYAYALRTLAATGDHEKSLRTDNVTATENRFHIGFNPYFKASHAAVFKIPEGFQQYMTRRLPSRLGSAFRDIILDYYEEVSRDQMKEFPIYFAEKSLPEQDSRRGIRFMFPNVREIVLIRDMKDVICSSTSSSGASFDRALQSTFTAAKQLKSIHSEQNPNIMFLKYEDFVQDNTPIISKIFGFLGLASINSDEKGMSTLFSTHATSSTPAASIGRWKTDLTKEQGKACEILDPFMDHFGYSLS
jgi:hypothetical protein